MAQSTGIEYGEEYTGYNNYYGRICQDILEMNYPVFLGKTYAYNQISIGDSYNLCRNLTKPGNIYGLNNTKTDSHMMKNSEWGAVVYLSYSQYGVNGQNIVCPNNVDLNSQVNGKNEDGGTIYAITGYVGNSINATNIRFLSEPTLGDSISDGTNTSYAWYTTNGLRGSATQNITGVYDLSGCSWEYTAAYISNANISINGGALVSESDLKYKTIYPYSESSDTSIDNWNEYNKTGRYGDAILETSTGGYSSDGWNEDRSMYPNSHAPFFTRGSMCKNPTKKGIFSFDDSIGQIFADSSFRVVLYAR